jgi:hypothetical protein
MLRDKQIAFSFFSPADGSPLREHIKFFAKALRAACGQSPETIFHFGGGIRGGKTYTTLFTIYTIARMFPGSKVYIVRESVPSLERTVKPSFFKLINNCYKEYNQNKNYVKLHNGSVFYFLAEQIDKDKDLDRFKGLEANIFFLEQIEELSPKTYEKAKERVGTHIFEGAPMPLIFTTFNPTHVKWVRDTIYNPWKEGNIPEYMHISMVTAAQNPFIPSQQWKTWATMDDLMYKQYVLGDWDLVLSQKAFMHAFDVNKHVGVVEWDENDTVYLSFDFNVEPLVCIAAHLGENYLHIFKEFRGNKGLEELLARIVGFFGISTHFLVTGDASGHARNALLRKDETAYTMIQKMLDITRHQIRTPAKNLYLRDSRALCNTVIKNIDFKIDKNCKYTIEDLLTVEVNYKGEIERDIAINKKQDPEKSHLLDTVRYLIHTYFFNKYQYFIPTFNAFQENEHNNSWLDKNNELPTAAATGLF